MPTGIIDTLIADKAFSRTRSVVALVITHGDLVCLLRRSAFVGSDRGKWHCVTGFLDPGVDPTDQALTELREETGLLPDDLCTFHAGPVLELPDGRSGMWRVLVHRAEARHLDVRLNWENDDFRWVRWSQTRIDGDIVSWLSDVMVAAGLAAAVAA